MNPKYKIIIHKDHEGVHADLYEQHKLLWLFARWVWVRSSSNTLFEEHTVISSIKDWQENLDVIQVIDTLGILEKWHIES